MAKIAMMILMAAIGLYADTLERNCLVCHQKSQIPSQLIYKRYLLKYSTPERMQQVIYRYLKAPDKKNSIMPPQFFLKFAMKPETDLNDTQLHENIRLFLEKFDLKKRLVVE